MNDLSPYASVRPEMKTGDVIFFCGSGPLSWAIRKCTNSPFSHVGMVYRTAVTDSDDVVLLAESTIQRDESGKKVDGVQLCRLSWRIANYDGNAAGWAPLSARIRSILDTEAMVAALLKKQRAANHYSVLGLTSFIWRQIPGVGLLPWFQNQDRDGEFCSDLVVEEFAEGGLPALAPWKTSPQELFEMKLYDKFVPLFVKQPFVAHGFNSR